ncbi:hypothetical protein HK102_012386, partial [Quaeritorhiza haematococci]
GDRIAILAPNIPVVLEAHFAVPLAGGVIVCINTRLAVGEVDYILGVSGAKILFVDHTLVDLAKNAEKCGVQKVVVIHDTGDPRTDAFERFIEDGSRTGSNGNGSVPEFNEFPPLTDEYDSIALNFTSGTTGKPKGVMYHARGAFLAALDNVVESGMNAESTYLWTLPLFHCNGWCFAWATVAAGATNVMLRKIDYGSIWDEILNHGVTHYCG